jgi:hypothetical protein
VAEARALLATSPQWKQDEVKVLEILLLFHAVPSFVLVVTLYA